MISGVAPGGSSFTLVLEESFIESCQSSSNSITEQLSEIESNDPTFTGNEFDKEMKLLQPFLKEYLDTGKFCSKWYLNYPSLEYSKSKKNAFCFIFAILAKIIQKLKILTKN